MKIMIKNTQYIKNTQDFAQLIRELLPLEHNEEYVSYDVEPLFTNIPIHYIINNILEEIYIHNKLPHICSKLILKRLLLKLATKNIYIFQSQFYKETDDFTMGGPLSVTFFNIYLTKLEKDQLKSLKPKFYRRFVDDVVRRRLKNTHDSLFEKLNNYHERINLTVKTNAKKFLDTRILLESDIIKTEVYRKANTFLVHWKSQIPKRYKTNAINGDLGSGESAQIFIMRKTKSEVNFQA